jgi:pantothenate kinase
MTPPHEVSPHGVSLTLAELVDRGCQLAATGDRRILGVTGPPGAGKSTLAAALVAALNGGGVYLPMDGFHLANAELKRLGRQGRKGAPDTFDVDGFVALLNRVRHERGVTIYAPEFRRQIEEPIAGSIAILPHVPLVVTEGNYILLDTGPWAQIRGLLDEVWYLDLDEETRVERLVERHVRYGRSPRDAMAWAETTDGPNARLVAVTRARADLIITGLGLG